MLVLVGAFGLVFASLFARLLPRSPFPGFGSAMDHLDENLVIRTARSISGHEADMGIALKKAVAVDMTGGSADSLGHLSRPVFWHRSMPYVAWVMQFHAQQPDLSYSPREKRVTTWAVTLRVGKPFNSTAVPISTGRVARAMTQVPAVAGTETEAIQGYNSCRILLAEANQNLFVVLAR